MSPKSTELTKCDPHCYHMVRNHPNVNDKRRSYQKKKKKEKKDTLAMKFVIACEPSSVGIPSGRALDSSLNSSETSAFASLQTRINNTKRYEDERV